LYIIKYSGPGGAHGEDVEQGERDNPVVLSDAPAIRTRAKSSGACCPCSGARARGRRRTKAPDEAGARRRRLWELDPTLHCSIIRTCLTTGELVEIVRRIVRGESLTIATSSDHEVHGHGVRFAQRRDGPGKLLHKALDRRHAAAIRSFASATDEEGIEAR
jgi:hypothetical protein